MIKRGGENVSCVELENIISAHPKIQDIVVVGIKDAIRDEAIKAFIVLNEGETLSEAEFSASAKQYGEVQGSSLWRSEPTCRATVQEK